MRNYTPPVIKPRPSSLTSNTTSSRSSVPSVTNKSVSPAKQAIAEDTGYRSLTRSRSRESPRVSSTTSSRPNSTISTTSEDEFVMPQNDVDVVDDGEEEEDDDDDDKDTDDDEEEEEDRNVLSSNCTTTTEDDEDDEEDERKKDLETITEELSSKTKKDDDDNDDGESFDDFYTAKKLGDGIVLKHCVLV